jgi:hypothetical protein
MSGRKSWSKQLRESALAGPNKLAMGAMPFARTALEAATGKTLFPDMMKPKPIRDRTEHLLRSISLDMPYRYAMGIPTRGIDTDIMGTVLAYTDPGEAAYYRVLQTMGDYLEERHQEKGSYEPTEKSNALFYFKKARQRSDKQLSDYWLDKYKSMGGTSKSILQSVNKADPMAFLPRKERFGYVQSLDDQGRRNLKDARDYWKRIYKGSSMYR